MKTFAEWIENLHDLMKIDGIDHEDYCDDETWIEVWEEDMTPEDAWDSEKSYWED